MGSPFIKPQLASFAPTPPTGPGWLFERKYDGHRLQIHLDGGTVIAFTRNGHDVTAKIKSLLPALRSLAHRKMVLDGELCAWSEDDTTDLSALAATLHHDGPFRFFAFDLLNLDGESLHEWPLVQRKALLADIFNAVPSNQICVVPFQLKDGALLFNKMASRGHEGIIAKQADGIYRPGLRTSEWKKIKVFQRVLCTVVGWQPDKTNGFVKSLILAIPRNSSLSYCGRVGTGFSIAERHLLHTRLQGMECSTPALALPSKMNAGVRWCRPHLMATIQAAEFSNRGILRIPSYIGVVD